MSTFQNHQQIYVYFLTLVRSHNFFFICCKTKQNGVASCLKSNFSIVTFRQSVCERARAFVWIFCAHSVPVSVALCILIASHRAKLSSSWICMYVICILDYIYMKFCVFLFRFFMKSAHMMFGKKNSFRHTHTHTPNARWCILSQWLKWSAMKNCCFGSKNSISIQLFRIAFHCVLVFWKMREKKCKRKENSFILLLLLLLVINFWQCR